MQEVRGLGGQPPLLARLGPGVTIGQGRGGQRWSVRLNVLTTCAARQRPGAGVHRPRGPLLRPHRDSLGFARARGTSRRGRERSRAGRTDGVAPIYGRADRRCSPTRRWGARCASPRPRWRGPTPPRRRRLKDRSRGTRAAIRSCGHARRRHRRTVVVMFRHTLARPGPGRAGRSSRLSTQSPTVSAWACVPGAREGGPFFAPHTPRMA